MARGLVCSVTVAENMQAERAEVKRKLKQQFLVQRAAGQEKSAQAMPLASGGGFYMGHEYPEIKRLRLANQMLAQQMNLQNTNLHRFQEQSVDRQIEVREQR